MHLDEYLILWNFCKFDRKEKGKGALCLLGQNSRSAAGPAREVAQRTGARACARFKPDGRGPGVSERERGRWRGEADRRGPPVIPNPATGGRRAHRQCFRARRGELMAPLDSSSCRRSGGARVGRRGAVVRRRQGSRWRSVGRRWLRPFPTAKRAGKRGESISELWAFQRSNKEGRGLPIP